MNRELKDWKKIKISNYDKYIEEYKLFMCDPDNEGNCDYCPCSGDGNTSGRLLCGQSNCWCSHTVLDRYIEEEK